MDPSTTPQDSATSVDSGPVDSASGTTDPAPAELDEDLVVVIGDYGEEVRFFLRSTGELWASQRLSSWFPAACGNKTCRLLGFQHSLEDDTDEFTLAYTRPVEAGQEHLGGVQP